TEKSGPATASQLARDGVRHESAAVPLQLIDSVHQLSGQSHGHSRGALHGRPVNMTMSMIIPLMLGKRRLARPLPLQPTKCPAILGASPRCYRRPSPRMATDREQSTEAATAAPAGVEGGPMLRLVDRRAFVGFPALSVAPGLAITDFGLQV